MSVENLFDSPLTEEELAIQTCRSNTLGAPEEGGINIHVVFCTRTYKLRVHDLLYNDKLNVFSDNLICHEECQVSIR
jgi:hypothetical protein